MKNSNKVLVFLAFFFIEINLTLQNSMKIALFKYSKKNSIDFYHNVSFINLNSGEILVNVTIVNRKVLYKLKV